MSLGGCAQGALPWVERVFGDCIYNARDLVGFCCGLCSVGCWLVAQMPQLYRNYRSQSAEALSPWFLAEWLLGDTFNLLGALLKGDQLPTVVFTAQYFICVDAVMMVQYIYYISLQRRRERMLATRRHRHHHHHHHRRQQHHQQHGGSSSSAQQQQRGASGSGGGAVLHEHGDQDAVEIMAGSGSDGAAAMDAGSSSGGLQAAATAAAAAPVPAARAVAGGRDVSFRPQRALSCLGTFLVLTQLQPWSNQQQQQQQELAAVAGQQQWHSHRRLLSVVGAIGGGSGWGLLGPHWAYTTGTVLGYASSVLYLTSRVSQIYKNFRRQSAEGLAISMFLCAIAANSLYGASILIRSYTWAELRSSLPWLIGSLGTVALDLTIFAQARMFARRAQQQKQHPSDDEEAGPTQPLLPP